MTTNNGWPGKPGVPLNPEKDGWHWVGLGFSVRKPTPCPVLWRPRMGWTSPLQKRGPDDYIYPEAYLGPCLTPDEVQNLRDDLASAERERAHQHGRADRNAAERAREQAKREALQKRVAELEDLIRAIHRHAKNLTGDRNFDQCITALMWIDDLCRKTLGGKNA